MGYCVEVDTNYFELNVTNEEKVLSAIKQGIINKEITGEGLVSFSSVLDSETLEEAMAELRFKMKRWDYTSATLHFTGEKYGGYEYDLFKVLAPYVADDDCYIHYTGEDGEIWRYYFKDGQCKEIYPTWDI